MSGKCNEHDLFIMALLYLIIALIIQDPFTNANDTEELIDSQESVNQTEIFDEIGVESDELKKEWMDMFLLPETPLYPTSSTTLMSQTIDSEKPVEEQIEDIKNIAEKITLAIQSEMANLLTYALAISDKGKEGEDQENNNLRKKRSADTPMDSSKLITRLLKHIKNNNEYQNIAIEKMMTAQEIADKYGIDYRPDTEILSDLTIAANQNAKEITSMLKDACNINASKNIEPVQIFMGETPYVTDRNPEHNFHQSIKNQPEFDHFHYTNSYPNYNYYYNYPYETQIPSPLQNYYSPPVTKKPDFYDTISHDIYPYCSVDPVSSIIMPFEETVEAEPELVGEEFEETISSKVLVDRGDEPGSTTVNHVMTYTVSEKSHFRTPEIERLPQQMQYCFFLM